MFHSSVFWVVLAEDLIEILKWNAGFFDSSIYSKNIVDIVETTIIYMNMLPICIEVQNLSSLDIACVIV